MGRRVRDPWRSFALIALAWAVVAEAASTPASAQPGDLDPNFGTHGVAKLRALPADGRATDLIVLPDDRIVAAGETGIDYDDSGIGTPAVVRLTPSGSLDSSFGDGGILMPPPGMERGSVMSVSAYADGRLLVLGGGVLVRLKPDGTPDESFSGDGVVDTFGAVAATAAPDGSAVVGGQTNAGAYIAQLDSSGRLDPGFAEDGIAKIPEPVSYLFDLALDPAGRIAAAGAADSPESGLVLSIVRLLPSGEADSQFSDDGVALVPCRPCGRAIGGEFGIEAPSDGGLVASARFNEGLDTSHRIVRVDDAGEPDATFGDGGTVSSSPFDGFALDGERILLAGSERVANPDPTAFLLSRLLPDGSPDPGFGVAGRAAVNVTEDHDALISIGVQSSGRIVAGGLADWRFAVAGFRDDAGTANADADAFGDSADTCPRIFGDHRSGCPIARRRLVLRRGAARGGERAFVGFAASKAHLCTTRNHEDNPEILKRRPGRDKLVGRSHVGGNVDPPKGAEHVMRFELVRPATRGAYYARVPRAFEPDLGICRRARSDLLRIK